MKEKLRTESASPLYAQIMEQIRQDILRGVYTAGSRIPTETELEKRYAVSRVTVRRALSELTDEGLLERKQGKGTFVALRQEERKERPLRGFHETCRARGLRPRVLRAETRERDAEAGERRQLNLQEEARVLEIRRVLAADGEPVILEKCCFSMAYAWLAQADLGGSLYDLLQEYGVQAEKSTYDLSLVQAGAEAAQMLKVGEDQWLLRAEQVVYDQRGRPLHTAVSLIRGDRYTLWI